MSALRLRVKNCLQTIVDLAPELRASRYGALFAPNLRQLRAWLGRVDHMALDEASVSRLERAVEALLAEVHLSPQPTARRLVQ